jgi:hypothetical protein
VNCAEVLSTLSTASLRDMTPDSPVMAHCANCAECSRVTTIVRQQEYEAATTLNGLAPMSNPIALAEQAVERSRRRKLGRVAVMMTGTALVATIWIASWLTIIPALNRGDAVRASSLRTETIPLSCLSPQQAADIINPYVRSRGSTYYTPTTGIAAITIRGTAAEIAKSRDLLHEFETDPGAACRPSSVTPASPAPEAVTEGAAGGAAGGVAGSMVPELAGDPAGKVATKPKTK